jgi:hypothetical protein
MIFFKKNKVTFTWKDIDCLQVIWITRTSIVTIVIRTQRFFEEQHILSFRWRR